MDLTSEKPEMRTILITPHSLNGEALPIQVSMRIPAKAWDEAVEEEKEELIDRVFMQAIRLTYAVQK